jgi:hypothetical protein
MNRTFATLLVASCVIPACTISEDPPSLPLADPPPITGGTLAITDDGIAVAADPDRDVVWLADLTTHDAGRVTLTAGDQPGRVAIDAAGRAHVVLRGSGGVATIDPRHAKLLDRRDVCPAPRGIAYDAASDVLHVACAGGELVTLSAAGGAPVRSLRLDRDLRDVVVQGQTLLISRFRSAELLQVSATGDVVGRQAPLSTGSQDPSGMDPPILGSVPTVAWRTVAFPGGLVAMAHQMATSGSVGTDLGAYGWGSACGGPVVGSTVTFFDSSGGLHVGAPMSPVNAVLPVDLAVDESGMIAVVSAGTKVVSFVGTAQDLASSAAPFDSCSPFDQQDLGLDVTPVAIASWQGRFFVQTRERAGLVVMQKGTIDSTIGFGGPLIASHGATLFHQGWNGVACASCHPEGSEDGHTWTFDKFGQRRTQTLAGGILQRAPFHWRGEFSDFQALASDVLLTRMEGEANEPSVAALGRWLDTVPAPTPSPTGTADQIAHGKQLFSDPQVGCATCHSGEYLTDNTRRDVGTGTTFQVPSLIGISARAPFFHDGCAATLEDRFDPGQATCNGGDAHGHTSQLGADDIRDLIAYLDTL